MQEREKERGQDSARRDGGTEEQEHRRVPFPKAPLPSVISGTGTSSSVEMAFASPYSRSMAAVMVAGMEEKDLFCPRALPRAPSGLRVLGAAAEVEKDILLSTSGALRSRSS